MQSCVQQRIERLDQLNNQRIEWALDLMTPSGQEVFQLIPALFHHHHPELPGFIDNAVPYGISQFSSSQPQFDLLLKYLDSPQKLEQSPENQDILGLYAMGSTASIGQNISSDLDIWVCVSPSMQPELRKNLALKCEKISQWANSQGTEVSLFVMDEQRFKAQHSEALTGDNCGSSQHILLLDEFYRTSIRMAGQRLLWEVIPPDMEESYEEYKQQLCSSQQIDCSQWIDFGRLPAIPAEEYFGANLWQLFKSIDSPYKSVLKAILLEAYSWEYPNTRLLSLDMKQRFFDDDVNQSQMDAYCLMLEKVTNYLEQTNDSTRLDLVRQCFYLKTKEKITREPGLGSTEWRRKALAGLTSEWGWNQDTLELLDNRRNWKIQDVKKMHHQLLEALMQSYRNLIQFARRNNITSAISPQDISILARKLYAAFEELPSKVTLLSPQIAKNLYEPCLTFIQSTSNAHNRKGWYLYKQPLIAEKILGQPAIENEKNLIKLVAWAFFNGLMTEATRLDAAIKTDGVDINKLYRLVSDLRNTFSLRKRRPTMEALASPCEISQLALFVNVENDPTVSLSKQALKAGHHQANVFSFGRKKENLVGSVDVVYRNSWHEVRTMSFKGEHCLLDSLKTLLGKMHQDAIPPESLDVFCYSQQLSGMLRNSVYQLLSECVDKRLQPFEASQRQGYKKVNIGDKLFGLFFERRGVSIQQLDDHVDFYRSVSDQKLNGSPLAKLDRDKSFELPQSIECFASEGLVQFFFEDTENGFNIYVLDEENQAEAYHQHNEALSEKDDIVRSINEFYANSAHATTKGVLGANFNLPQYYQIVHPQFGDSYVAPYSTKHIVKSIPSREIGVQPQLS